MKMVGFFRMCVGEVKWRLLHLPLLGAEAAPTVSSVKSKVAVGKTEN